jgi:hypothetical protein
MSLRSSRPPPAGFIAPCLPTSAPQPPSGELYSRPGNDLTWRFPLIVEAVTRLRSRSCILDGEAVSCGDDGIASFDRIRHRHHDADAFLYAFDLIEFNGDDLRRDPLVVRKATLADVLARAAPALRLNEHLNEEDGPLVFQHACKLGLEGIVSKRKDSRPNAPAVRRKPRRIGENERGRQLKASTPWLTRGFVGDWDYGVSALWLSRLIKRKKLGIDPTL